MEKFILLEYQGIEFKAGIGNFWLTQSQIVEFYGAANKQSVSRILKSAESTRGLLEDQIILITITVGDNTRRKVRHYGMDAILYVGFHFKRGCGYAQKATALFRQFYHGERWPITGELDIEFEYVEYALDPGRQSSYLSRKDWRWSLEWWHYRCAYCGKESNLFHQDHIVPRSKGGSNSLSNIIPACGYCNCAKNNLDLDYWLEKNFSGATITEIRDMIAFYQLVATRRMWGTYHE